jgi:pSer/pThr/pTyr-binding forkhead associated (FHA) protein
MAETVRLTVKTGAHRGRRFCFRGPVTCLVGRGDDCFVHFSGSERDLKISRRHCQLEIDPPQVRLEDLGSLNGTYVNGHAVKAAGSAEPPAPERIQNGDVITIAGTTFCVDVVDCPPPYAAMELEPVWREGELAKADCSIPCALDDFRPCVGCCAGGIGVPRTP